ncbi:hypothetical protein H7H78_12615 [Mycobacterium shinjukuense]|uniref:DUF7159 domain-containing protein n=1 Tax=Mycobacterium shinjukuense TaxID=398694 RepID=A0A7I7MSL7_9MYCO|nr:hypothetical protein [Mycobacterium shinjukuense]MCV6986245.1 hypothetical protein [Mycobacterium shinjukuense]BBX75258.1 hypothetical protein MSHI_31640 [Mycobacterium shinjukuense]
MALVAGDGGAIIDEDRFRIVRDTTSVCASDQVIAAILGTGEGAVEAGLRLMSIGVAWTDEAQATAPRDALTARKLDRGGGGGRDRGGGRGGINTPLIPGI